MNIEKTIALFGGKILENPEHINVDGFIGEEKFVEEKITKSMFDNILACDSFLKSCNSPEIQNYLRLIFENQNSQKKMLASLSMAKESLNLNLSNSLQNKQKFDNIKEKLNDYMKPSNESIAEPNPFENSTPNMKLKRK